MKIYTKTGDNGETSLFNGARVKKNNARIITYGVVDEVIAMLGCCWLTQQRRKIQGNFRNIIKSSKSIICIG